MDKTAADALTKRLMNKVKTAACVMEVVREMAMGLLAEFAGSTCCLYCKENYYAEFQREVNQAGVMIHEPDCPVTLARTLMAEWGMPLCIYKTQGECQSLATGQWQPFCTYNTAFSQEGVQIPTERCRNVTLEFVREFPLERTKQDG